MVRSEVFYVIDLAISVLQRLRDQGFKARMYNDFDYENECSVSVVEWIVD